MRDKTKKWLLSQEELRQASHDRLMQRMEKESSYDIDPALTLGHGEVRTDMLAPHLVNIGNVEAKAIGGRRRDFHHASELNVPVNQR